MTDPIYPDKEKTGLAALKPLLMAYCDEPERWVWEDCLFPPEDKWQATTVENAISCVHRSQSTTHYFRLTPKPRRVWIGDESFPEPVKSLCVSRPYHVVDVLSGGIRYLNASAISPVWVDNGFVFDGERAAQQCLDAYRKARRVE